MNQLKQVFLKTFLNKDGTLSIGRTTFALLMCTCFNFWWDGVDIPPNLYMCFATVLVYELGKKGRDTYETVKMKGNENA